MARFHNKKRNVGIIYEQIIKFVCNSLLAKNEEKAKKATNIIKKSFAEGTQLHKEYKLFKALINTKGVSDSFATSIINEAKKACNNHFNEELLENEKSLLIKNLNVSFGKDTIFKENIKNYKEYATVQVLLNEWRTNKNFDIATEYEVKLHNLLTESKEKEVIQEQPKNINNLTFRLMKEIFNKKYKSKLSKQQQDILFNYTNGNNEKVTSLVSETKKETNNLLESYINKCNNNILLEKYTNIKTKLDEINEEDVSRENLQKFLVIEKLREELLSEEN